MPASLAERRPPAVIIDLLSSDDEEEKEVIQARPAPRKRARRDSLHDGGLPHEPPELHDREQQAGPGAGFTNFDGFDMSDPHDEEPALDDPMPTGQFVDVDGEQVFIPDEIPAPPRSAQPGAPEPQNSFSDPDASEFTLDLCMQRVLAVLPDVDHEHMAKLYNEANEVKAMNPTTSFKLGNILEKLLTDPDYPRQVKQQPPTKKRRREDEIEEQSKAWEDPGRPVAPHQFKGTIASMLKAEFPELPKQRIVSEVARHKHFYQTYLALASLKDTDDGNTRWRGRPSLVNLATADTIATNSGWAPMIDELKAARDRVKEIRRRRVIEEVHRKAEQENLQRAIDNNETSECQVCFDDLPMNRQIHCDGVVAHFTCFDCAELYVKTEVGDARCRVECTAGCGAPFARSQLYLLKDKELLVKLEKLQQEKDIRDAGLEGLEECPFCIDYKIILGPIEEDSEFRCANPECEKVSCRRCKAASHVPLSCEEHAKDNKISSRHKIEEKMSEALIRSCNNCKKKFIKMDGCNKMTCPSCRHLQCYVCSASIKDYTHFNHMPGSMADRDKPSEKCPLYDNSEERHEREVGAAEAAARAEVMKEQPDITKEDLDIKISDAVKKSALDRIRQALPAGLGAPGPLDIHALFPRLYGRRADVNEVGGDLARMYYPLHDRHENRGAYYGANPPHPRAGDIARQLEAARARVEQFRGRLGEHAGDMGPPAFVARFARFRERANDLQAQRHAAQRLLPHAQRGAAGAEPAELDGANQLLPEDGVLQGGYGVLARAYQRLAPAAAADGQAAANPNTDAQIADHYPHGRLRLRDYRPIPLPLPAAVDRPYAPNDNINPAAADYPAHLPLPDYRNDYPRFPAVADGPRNGADQDLPNFPPFHDHEYGRPVRDRLGVPAAERIVPDARRGALALRQEAAVPRVVAHHDVVPHHAADNVQPAAEQDPFGADLPDHQDFPYDGDLMDRWDIGGAMDGRGEREMNGGDELDELLEMMRRPR